MRCEVERGEVHVACHARLVITGSWQWRLALGMQLLSLGCFEYIHGRQGLSFIYAFQHITLHLRMLLKSSAEVGDYKWSIRP